MATLIHKIQVLLSHEQYQALLALAKAQGKRLSGLLREAVVEQLLKDARRTAKQKAFEEITSMELPVGDWSEMEKGIERDHSGARKRS